MISMTHKQLLSFFMLFSFYNIYSTPANTPSENDFRQYLQNTRQNRVVKSIENNPIKTIMGMYLLYDGHNNIKIAQRYKQLLPNTMASREWTGYAFLTIGTLLLLPVIYDAIYPENSDAEKTKSLELPDKK